jgi:hypothetical protein
MNVVRSIITIFALGFTAALASACGGNASLSPTAPSSASSGASISGTISGSAMAAVRAVGADAGSFSALESRGVTITIVGTGISTTADNQGQFTLTNVPTGTVTLNFTAPGANATITLTGVGPNDKVQISVTVNGNSAHVDSEHHSKPDNDKREFQGRILTIDATETSFTISGLTVKTTDTTIIRHGNRRLTFADLKVGDHVEARGTKDGTTLTGTEIKVEADEGNDDDHDNGNHNGGEAEGVVSGSTGTCPAVTFMVGTKKITTDSSTSFRHGTCADATTNGAMVEVKGTKQSDGSILATRVELEKKAPTTVTLTGAVSGSTGTCPDVSFTVQSKTVTVNSSTTYTSTTCAVATANDANVTVTGTNQSDGSVLATTVALAP